MFSVPRAFVLMVLMGLYMYLTGEAGDAKWYISSTAHTYIHNETVIEGSRKCEGLTFYHERVDDVVVY